MSLAALRRSGKRTFFNLDVLRLQNGVPAQESAAKTEQLSSTLMPP